MKTIAMIAAGLLVASTPAFAQDAGAPGATGVGGPLTGSNTGTGYPPGAYNSPYGYGYGYNNGWNDGYRNEPYNYETPGVVVGPMIEGRAAAPDYDYYDDYTTSLPRRGRPTGGNVPQLNGTPSTQW
jgi:hypothetical protein